MNKEKTNLIFRDDEQNKIITVDFKAKKEVKK